MNIFLGIIAGWVVLGYIGSTLVLIKRKQTRGKITLLDLVEHLFVGPILGPLLGFFEVFDFCILVVGPKLDDITVFETKKSVDENENNN
jgi:hypothetical protein